MELEEAKEKIKKLITTKFINDYSIDSSDKEAIEIVLQALENSVIKDIIREKIKELEYCQSKCITFEGSKIMENKIQVLKELL